MHRRIGRAQGRKPGTMPIMQIEAIAALTASGAAVLGVPAALVVGFRQARAARLAAETTAQAARDQWRRNARREAAVTFALTAEREFDIGLRVRRGAVPLDEVEREITEAHRATRHALAVVRLEGPEQLARCAKDAARAVRAFTDKSERIGLGRHAWYSLQHAADEGNEAARAVLALLNEASSPSETDTAWAALAETDTINRQQIVALRELFQMPTDRPRPWHVAHSDTPNGEARAAIDAFIVAVRAHLDELSTG